MTTISRRSFLVYAMSLSLVPHRLDTAIAQVDDDYTDPMAASEWMNEWLKNATTREERTPINPLRISRFADPMYFITGPIGWRPDANQPNYARVNVPVGFVTDFASIPRLFWSALRPDGDYAYAAVIHDYLYWEQSRSRNDADVIFRLAMEDFKIDPATVQTLFRAVRLGGDRAWNSNANLKAKGERRILKRFPEDPRIRWKDWKVLNNVF